MKSEATKQKACHSPEIRTISDEVALEPRKEAYLKMNADSDEQQLYAPADIIRPIWSLVFE